MDYTKFQRKYKAKFDEVKAAQNNLSYHQAKNADVKQLIKLEQRLRDKEQAFESFVLNHTIYYNNF